MSGLGRVLMLALVAVLTTADAPTTRADLPRVDVAAQDALSNVAHVLALFDRTPNGAFLYQANCASCHGGAQGGTADQYPPRHNAAGHTWHHADCDLEQIVRSGPAPGLSTPSGGGFAASRASQMPAFRERLTDDEIRAVLAHIKTFWTEDQRAAQAATTARTCAPRG